MLTLPDYPWDTLTPYRERAAAHPDGVADLSIGTPVDPTPALIRRALTEAADAHGYPTTHGTADLRRAVVDWYARRRGVAGLDPEAVAAELGFDSATDNSLDGTASLAGTVTSVNGNVYTFALICNDADVLAARRAMDEFTSALREF